MATRLVLTGALLLSANLFVGPTNVWSRTTYPVVPGSPQQGDGWVTIKTNEGMLFVWNVRGLYFTLAVKGKEIKPLEDPDHIFFSVDGQMLQIQTAALSNFAADAREKKLEDKTILVAHRDWEAKYIEDLIHTRISVRTFNTKLSNGRDALMWQFDMPEGMNTDAQKQLYLTLVAKDYVLMLNSEANAAFSDADGRKFLLDTIATLKLSPTRIDVKQLSESIRAASAKP
ncbi:MAG: hypothetical protein ABJA18_11180 [bacterium]